MVGIGQMEEFESADEFAVFVSVQGLAGVLLGALARGGDFNGRIGVIGGGVCGRVGEVGDAGGEECEECEQGGAGE